MPQPRSTITEGKKAPVAVDPHLEALSLVLREETVEDIPRPLQATTIPEEALFPSSFHLVTTVPAISWAAVGHLHISPWATRLMQSATNTEGKEVLVVCELRISAFFFRMETL